MIEKIISFSVKNKLIIGLMTIALVVTGIWSITKVPLDAVPDITNNQIQVITQAPNLGTEDIEQFVTYPIEVSMANLPGIVEVRSISRFGLSVVTLVFEDDMGTYLPRQLVSEKLVEVKAEIPAQFGEPHIGPIATGLGEIYQYTLEVDAAYAQEYDLRELRSIQDWIIRRQMAMVPGVVEVNAFGGDVKEYEIAVDPEELRAMDISITEVFDALERNNENTGSAYIEKNHFANFIRGEGLIKSLEDIKQIVVQIKNDIPITIGDVAEVQYGNAIRYGALTKDGKGEAVGGMILMLKGANSNDVIANVQERINEIQKSLPTGVHIKPFLERSDLISSTTSTLARNLIEGALIVIFVLVILLGNWRGGLIVASTIPLSLLFAFILMHYFDVWANLMSLGAIDFGIIVDGAVIIVEGTVFMIHDKFLNKKLNQQQRDDAAISSSSKMMKSAFFGQLIILIVFIPILTLEGVEGKMFKPMAYTFMFAMIGVMLLCLTYVPMMSAWFLRGASSNKLSRGDKFILWLERIYTPALQWVLHKWKLVLTLALLALGSVVWLFSRMGGEFIPQLDEGDIAYHVILTPGSSLSEMTATTTNVEKIILENFPEAKTVLSRIGVADVPTDPMPMDLADCFVILKPQDEWTSASTKTELIKKMKAKISEVPGVAFEFTQPIEMRFNELITGVREDIAIKLFGEDLDILAEKAEEIGQLIGGVQGVGDMKVEATAGLPQITIDYNRRKLAQYGLNISDINKLVQSSIAGSKAGVIFEGERRFDLVVRLQEEKRSGITDLKNLYVRLPNNSQIPLRELAEISYQPGPMQISRDNTNRRTYVGINVRDRDIASLVEEIQSILDEKLDLPPGYFIRYGGAFENLERASAKLKLVVPIALSLILILMFFALKSMSQSIMIFFAIPFACIGGILALFLRDMPFSISAGVGFIVLFGVAVLNGLVLVSSWNELKEEESDLSLTDRISKGAKRRIRPILLTALTDVLGFLPMAISTSAGAEVQQPLATVVIGGMISATLLTLFVLPIFYKIMENKNSNPSLKKAVAVLAILLVSPQLMAQEKVITQADEAVSIALENNQRVQMSKLDLQQYEALVKTAVNLNKTNIGVNYGQINSYQNDYGISITQSFELPHVYLRDIRAKNAQVNIAKNDQAMVALGISEEVRKTWMELSYLHAVKDILQQKDTLFTKNLKAATLRLELEGSNILEKANAETQLLQVKNDLFINAQDISIQENKLHFLLQDSSNYSFDPQLQILDLMLWNKDSLAVHPSIQKQDEQVKYSEAQLAVEKSKLSPTFTLGYFNISMIGSPYFNTPSASYNDRFQAVELGVAIPLFFGAQKAQIKARNIALDHAKTKSSYALNDLTNQVEVEILRVEKEKNNLKYFEEKALVQAELILEKAQLSYQEGAIDYIEYFQNINFALDIKVKYLESINAYNQSIIHLSNLLGKK